MAPPTIFPRVTGIKFAVKKFPKVKMSTEPWAAKIPVGIKNILATLCSNPQRTKVKIGKKQAKIFPIISCAPKDIHTARQTNQLQPIPRKNAAPQS